MHSKPPVIFFGFTNDKQTAVGYLRNLTRERNALRTALEAAAERGYSICKLIMENDLTVDRIFDVFQNEKYRDRIGEQQYNRNPFQQDLPAVIGAE